MPKMNGIEAAAHLRVNGSVARVVFLPVHEDPDFIRAALATKALGYVVNSRMASDLHIVIREALLAERIFISPSCCYASPEESQ